MTPSIFWDNKISKIGLCPKSQSKKSSHPERVYLTYNIDEAEYLIQQLFAHNTQEYKYKNEYSVLETKISHNIKLFRDTNYPYGIYTLNNIPPQDIKEIKRYSIQMSGIMKRIK